MVNGSPADCPRRGHSAPLPRARSFGRNLGSPKGCPGGTLPSFGVAMKLLSIDVRFEYPVHFTSGAFDPANGVLAESIKRKEPARRHRVLLVLDRGVVDTR